MLRVTSACDDPAQPVCIWLLLHLQGVEQAAASHCVKPGGLGSQECCVHQPAGCSQSVAMQPNDRGPTDRRGYKLGCVGRYEQRVWKLFPGKPTRGDFGEEVVQLSACFSQQVNAGKLVHDRQPYRSPVNAEAQTLPPLRAQAQFNATGVPRTTRATPRWGPRRQQIDCG